MHPFHSACTLYQSFGPMPEKGLAMQVLFQLYSPSASHIATQFIRLTPSDIALRAVIRRIKYHCSEGAISLCGIAAKYHISRKRDISLSLLPLASLDSVTQIC